MSTHTAFVRLGEYGFTFQLKTDYQSTGFDSATMHFTKPNGSVSSQTCDNNDGSAGEWGWIVTEDFFDQKGFWSVGLEIDLGDDGTRKSRRPALFLVGGDLE